jgi:hypothetical protein
MRDGFSAFFPEGLHLDAANTIVYGSSRHSSFVQGPSDAESNRAP